MKLKVYTALTEIIDNQNKMIETLITKVKELEALVDELLSGKPE